MNLQHVNVKVFVDGDLNVDLERFIEVFHQWVGEQSMEEMLIDVADYRHVPQGPVVLLVGREADYVMDHSDGRYGLVYNRKAPLDGDNAGRFLQALRAALKACSLLEAELDNLRFSRTEFQLFINDRALAPNTAETREAFQSELSAFLQEVADECEIDIGSCRDERTCVGAIVRLANALKLE